MKRYLLAVAAAVLVGCGTSAPEEESAPKAVVAVKVATAERRDLELTVSAPATVFAREQSNIAARITAPIRQLLVKKGDTVRAGQTLAVLEDRDLRAQRAEAVASVADAQASLEKMTAGTIPTDLEKARGQVATSAAAFQLAQKTYEQRKQLFDQGAIPRRDLSVTESELAQTQANLDVARKSLELLEKQSGGRDIRIAESKLAQAEARLASLDAQLTYTELKSPFEGVITEQLAYPGDMAKPDSTIFTVADLSVAVARTQVPEASVASVHTGAACRFHALDRPAESVAGRVTVINRAVDTARRTVEVWCEIPRPPTAVRVGSFGESEIVTGRAPKAIVVPVAAVQFEEGSHKGIVMVAAADSTARRKEVECGPTTSGMVQILSGVEAGERVIVEAGFGLPDGTKITMAAKP